jgi:hypothetical protein
VCAALPPVMKQILGRVDSGSTAGKRSRLYEGCNARFAISARETSRMV